MEIVNLLLVIALAVVVVRLREKVHELEEIVCIDMELIDELHEAVFGPCACPQCLEERTEERKN